MFRKAFPGISYVTKYNRQDEVRRDIKGDDVVVEISPGYGTF